VCLYTYSKAANQPGWKPVTLSVSEFFYKYLWEFVDKLEFNVLNDALRSDAPQTELLLFLLNQWSQEAVSSHRDTVVVWLSWWRTKSHSSFDSILSKNSKHFPQPKRIINYCRLLLIKCFSLFFRQSLFTFTRHMDAWPSSCNWQLFGISQPQHWTTYPT
jgi:hypothetical protein